MAAECRPTAGRRAQSLFLGVVPGFAQVLVLDRPGSGTLFFVLFVLGVWGMVAGRFLLMTEYAADLYSGGAAAASAAWVISYADVVRLVLFRDYEKRASLRAEKTAEGVRAYVRDDLAAAHAAFRKCLSLDDTDVDALFWFGCTEARRGKGRRARRAFRRCIRHDAEGKWVHECEEQLRGLDGIPLTPGPPK